MLNKLITIFKVLSLRQKLIILTILALILCFGVITSYTIFFAPAQQSESPEIIEDNSFQATIPLENTPTPKPISTEKPTQMHIPTTDTFQPTQPSSPTNVPTPSETPFRKIYSGQPTIEPTRQRPTSDNVPDGDAEPRIEPAPPTAVPTDKIIPTP